MRLTMYWQKDPIAPRRKEHSIDRWSTGACDSPASLFGSLDIMEVVDIQSSRQQRRLMTCITTAMGPDPRLQLYHVQLYLLRWGRDGL
jgi:hypothetical protein